MANNCSQLETFDIMTDRPYFSSNMENAWNNLLNTTPNTLKKLNIKSESQYSNLESLNLCQNLQELTGTFNAYDLKRVFQMKSLRKLELKRIQISHFHLGTKFNLPNRKYLSIHTYGGHRWARGGCVGVCTPP